MGIKMKIKQGGVTEMVVVLKKGISLIEQLDYVAGVIKTACPDLFKKTDSFPTVRMVKFKEGDIVYEISQGTSRAKTGPV